MLASFSSLMKRYLQWPHRKTRRLTGRTHISYVKLACHQQLSGVKPHQNFVLLRGVAQNSAYMAQNSTKVAQNSGVVLPLKAVGGRLTWRSYAYISTKEKDVVTKCLCTQLTFSHWWHQSASHKWLTLHCSLSLVTCRSRRQGYWGILIVTWCCYYTRLISSEFFICQQDSAPPHRALEPINFSPITLPNAELFQKFFQNRLSNTFVIRQWINFSSRLNHIATRCGVSLIIIAYMFQVVSVFPTSIFHKVV